MPSSCPEMTLVTKECYSHIQLISLGLCVTCLSLIIHWKSGHLGLLMSGFRYQQKGFILSPMKFSDWKELKGWKWGRNDCVSRGPLIVSGLASILLRHFNPSGKWLWYIFCIFMENGCISIQDDHGLVVVRFFSEERSNSIKRRSDCLLQIPFFEKWFRKQGVPFLSGWKQKKNSFCLPYLPQRFGHRLCLNI